MVWLIGQNGMLGKEVALNLLESNISFTGSGSEVDISDINALERFAMGKDIDWIINCAAYTAVDKAEEDKENCRKVNEIGPSNIAKLAARINAKLIHISTDYVFSGCGTSPYKEDMKKEPLGVYGLTKSNGEDEIARNLKSFYILRTAWLYGFEGKNFVYTMANLMDKRDSIKVVNDQKGSPTCTLDLSRAIVNIISKGEKSPVPFGIYHFTDMGETTWFSFAEKIYELLKKYRRISSDCTVNPCTTEEYPTPCRRPSYSVLSKEKIQSFLDFKIPSWEESLEMFIKSPRF